MKVDRTQLVEVVPGVLKKNDKTFYIECSINKTLHYCAAARLDKLKAKHGSLEAVGTSYISKDAKRIIKMATQVEKKDKKETTSSKPVSAQGMQLPRPNPYSTFTHADSIVFETVNSQQCTCLRGELFIKNEGYCNGCRWWNKCEYGDKKWKTFQGANPRNEEMFRLVAHPYSIHSENEA